MESPFGNICLTYNSFISHVPSKLESVHNVPLMKSPICFKENLAISTVYLLLLSRE